MNKNAGNNKPWKEKLVSFLKEPTRQNLQDLLQLEAIEDDDLEFKRDLLSSDLLARHLLAMANGRGGVIVFGVEETSPNEFNPCGLSNSYDITDIEKKLWNYLPKDLRSGVKLVPHFFRGKEHPEFEDKLFLVVIVDYNPRYIPFIAVKEGENLKQNIIYIRRNRASEPINHEELQEILNKRIDTEYSTTSERELREHLDELKELYKHIPKNVQEVISRTSDPLFSDAALLMAQKGMKRLFGEAEYRFSPNPNYPEENYEAFVGRLIHIKKEIIINLLKK